MTEKIFKVYAYWDAEACWWVAESEDVPGLATGARNVDDLIVKLRTLVPELLELNGALPESDGAPVVPFELMAQYSERITLAN